MRKDFMNTTAAQSTSTQQKLWTAQDYYRMSKFGVLKPDERTELIEGEIFVMAAKNPPHSAITKTAADDLRLLRERADIRLQEPVHQARSLRARTRYSRCPNRTSQLYRTPSHSVRCFFAH